MVDLLDERLKARGLKVVRPNEDVFASSIVQQHRKHEKAYHVKAFRGSKEGYLFFLPVGILWAFKKPLAFFAFDSIHAISYTSVLQRTFNLNVATNAPGNPEVEFSMLDQADFAGIDAYVKAHGLNDASLAAARKAKRYNVNPDKGAAAAAAENGAAPLDAAGDAETELQRAERMMEDEEDEEEEDYAPGSEGDSDGSGTSSEDEDAEGDEMEDDEEDDEGDLVKGELGSEAEGVEVSDEEAKGSEW
ncbi:histone chaperone Rttp106-like-domain-containing protein [Lineolata rhizophorae]|uniref:Histone chaperone Rttp106-like-domain-containing protein n=1 Tax=Lineolata rhizophorae TaxID=578093 RepID=A0A6A6PCJ6_9PEZI|nr:histone chaperone Rttp106-like-domain-containing protein [Lineolata rhizophorae]